MTRNKKWLALALCLLLLLGMSGCKKGEGASGSETETTAETTVETTQATQQSTIQESIKETTKATDASKASEETKKQTGETKAKKQTEKKETAKKSGQKPSGHVLTIKKGSKKVFFTEAQLGRMGTVSYKYSFRNKESAHRQFLSCKGVRFSTVLSKSGLSGSRARFRSTDGYTKEFSISELKASKKAFLKTTGSTAKDVPAVLTLGSSESFRLCFGQAADDTDDNGDYNAQHWIKWIDTIELY